MPEQDRPSRPAGRSVSRGMTTTWSLIEPDEARSTDPTTESSRRHVRTDPGVEADRPRVLAVLLGGIVSLLVAVRALVPGPIGLADDGGAVRYACQTGLTAETAGGSRFFDFAILRWSVGEVATGSEGCPSHASSVTWLAGALRWVAGLLGQDVVDLRLVSLLYAALCGLLVALVLLVIGGSVRRQVVVATGLLLVVADAAFVGFAGSLYAESTAVLGVLLLAAGLVLVDSRGPRAWAGLVVAVLGSALVTGARSTTAVLAVPVAIYVAIVWWRRGSRIDRRRWAARLAHHGVAVAAVLALVAPAVWTVAGESERARVAETWAMLTQRGLLDPEAASAELHSTGLTPGAVDLATTSPTTFESSDEREANAGVLRPSTVWSFLLAHPGRAVSALDDAARDYLTPRPAGLGSYPVDSQMPPKAQENRVVVVSSVTGWFAGGGLIVLGAGWALVALVAFRRARSANTVGSTRSAARASLVLLAGSMLGTATVAFGVGVAPDRAVVPAVLSGLLAGVLLVASRPSGPSPVVAGLRWAASRGATALSGASAALRESPARRGSDGARR